MRISYSRRSAPSARVLAAQLQELGVDVELTRSGEADINWGRANTNAQLNGDTSLSTDKLAMRRAFRDNDVPMPVLWDNPYEVVFPCVARKRNHMKGRGYWLCNNPRDLERAISKGAEIFMEYINVPTKEYRVQIFNGKSIRLSEKEFYIDEEGKRQYRTVPTTCGKSVKKQIRDAARRAVSAVGLEFAAVDVLNSEEGTWVLETNSAPGLGGSMPSVYAEAFAAHFGYNTA